MATCTVRFEPDAKEVTVPTGTTLLAAALKAGIMLNSVCGGEGVCGKCKVVVRHGDVNVTPSGRVSMAERQRGIVLACTSTVRGDCTIEIPPETRLDFSALSADEMKELRLKGLYSVAEDVDFLRLGLPDGLFEHSPLATKLYLELPEPTLNDNIPDMERLFREIRRRRDVPIMQMGLANVKHLGTLLRHSDWKVTVLLGKRNGTTEVVLVEAGDTSDRNYGLAVDIGTTTVTAQLVDLNSKQILGAKSAYNRQASFGSDVISRIIYAGEPEGLEKLHHAVVDNINDLIGGLVADSGVSLNNVTGVVAAGNTTMTHLLLKIPPEFIRKDPYIPTATFPPTIRAAEAGIRINPRGLLACVPGVSSYVGGDIVAGTLAAGFYDSEETSMLIDIGTNGEIVVGNADWLMCCSASAGPAFEGSGLRCGMRASSGAIQHVSISGDTLEATCRTVGNADPRGLCGSGLIDLLAELFRAGVIDRNGKFRRELDSPRVREGDEGLEYVVVWQNEAAVEHDIVVTEPDVDNLKRSKAAIYAAATVMLGSLGLDFSAVERVFVAGGFGTYLDIDKAVTIGMLPDLPRETFTFIGNSSLSGARAVLLSYEAMKRTDELAGKMTYLELSTEAGFMDEYVSALFFPHTDATRFPSVRARQSVSVPGKQRSTS